jgi:protein required for attachment to host cells
VTSKKKGIKVMAKTCIIVADGARARFITVEMPEDPVVDGGARLVEHEDLVNPEADLPDSEMFSDRRSRSHASPKGAAHALDDHRQQHRQELERRYARRVADEARRFVARQGASRLLIVAEPRTLGVLRREFQGEPLRQVAIEEIGENLSARPLAEIQSSLAVSGAVPGAQPPEVGVFRPRGQPVAGR